MSMLVHILEDAFFSAVAAIGFAAISRPPRRAYLYCALIAAVGHAFRYVLMNSSLHLHITFATLAASFVVGIMAVFLAPAARTPAEAYLFPSLLPMIPGIYAYKAFGGLARSLFADGQADFERCFYLFCSNGMTCVCILVCMVVGATVPIFVFKTKSFSATR